MAARKTTALPLPSPLASASGAATPFPVDDPIIQVSGTFTATVIVTGSVDGTRYEQLISTSTQGIFDQLPHVRFWQVTLSGYVSGTPLVTLDGIPWGQE